MSHKLVSLYIGDGEYYTRTDADAVIAELKADYKEACGRLQTANLIKDEQIAATRHQKYKRCLAMARWCENALLGWMGHKESFSSHQRYIKVMLFTKWHKRWLELAKKFKPNNSTAQ